MMAGCGSYTIWIWLLRLCPVALQAICLSCPARQEQPKVKEGGAIIYDSFGILEKPTRSDIESWHIPAMETAAEMQMIKCFNMFILGGFLKLHPIVSTESVMKALRKTLPERHHNLLPMNEKAILKGMEIIERD